MGFRADTSKFEDDIKRITKGLQQDPAVGRVLYKVGEELMKEAKRKAPREQGNLRNSAVIGQARKQSTFRWQQFNRFTAKYSNIQDTGFKKRKIFPKKAKALFVPLNERARRMGPARSIRSLTNGVDYIFRRSVTTPPLRKNQRLGPNLYFTGTVKEWISKGTIKSKITSRFDNWLRKFNSA